MLQKNKSGYQGQNMTDGLEAYSAHVLLLAEFVFNIDVLVKKKIYREMNKQIKQEIKNC